MRPWSNDQVLLWLRNSGYADEVVSTFRSHNITGLVLPFLNTEELKEMGIQNLRLRLKLMKDISTVLTELNSGTLSFEGDHPVMSQLQSTVMATTLVNILSQNIRDDVISTNECSSKSLLHQFTKLREELLPVLKELKNKKPLPTPSENSSLDLKYSHPLTKETVQSETSQKDMGDHKSYRESMMSEVATISSSRTGLRNSRLSQIDKQDQETINSLTSAISSAELLTAFTAVKEKPRIVPTERTVPIRTASSSSLPGSRPSNSSAHRLQNKSSNEPLKQLRARREDKCYKILQAAMRSHGLDISEWKNYALVIVYGGDQERILGYDEKPVMIFKELQDLGLNPSMMLRQVDEEDDLDYSKFDTPGGRL